jgi:hypothetical protein
MHFQVKHPIDLTPNSPLPKRDGRWHVNHIIIIIMYYLLITLSILDYLAFFSSTHFSLLNEMILKIMKNISL